MTKIFHPNRLRVVLAEKQIKNRWLAEQLGKSEMTISRWSTNKTQPSLDLSLNVSMTSLVSFLLPETEFQSIS